MVAAATKAATAARTSREDACILSALNISGILRSVLRPHRARDRSVTASIPILTTTYSLLIGLIEKQL